MEFPHGVTRNNRQGSLAISVKYALSLLPVLLYPAFAQQTVVAPTPAVLFSSIASTNNTLYVRGGIIQAQQVAQQFYSLDLTPLLAHSGNITWTKRNAGPLIDFRTVLPIAVNRENQGLIAFSDLGTVARYTIATNTWSKEVPICKTPINASVGIPSFQPALTDPRTGLIYIPYAYAIGNEMLVFNDESNACSGIEMPASSKGQLYAWSESRNSFFMLGGTFPLTRTVLWEFDLATSNWNNYTVDPQVLDDGCMVSASGGQKLVVFGGTIANGLRTGITYIFDTTSKVWTRGATSPKVRSAMTCATAGDYMVVWGGNENSVGEVYPSEMLYYNIVKDKWINKTDIVPPLVPTVYTSVLSSTTGASSTNTGLPRTDENYSKNINAAAIGGGAAAGAAVVLIAAVAFFLIRSRRKRSKAKRDPQNLKVESIHHPNTSKESLSTRAHVGNIDHTINSPHAPLDQAASFPHYKSSIHDNDIPIQDQQNTASTNAENQSSMTAGEDYVSPLGYYNQPHQSHGPLSPTTARAMISYPVPPPLPMSPQLHSTSLYLEQDGEQQPHTLNSPQHFESPLASVLSRSSPDYDQLQQELPSPVPASARNPQGPMDDAIPVNNNNNPLEEIALVQAKYEEHIERVRQEQQAEVERIRRDWEEQMARGS
ncbi:hypothetical protein FBU30_007399 [Linnemannia zychae]|nr:hypothetical protein FBU30_007399 [Linnemannia zychae]